MKVLAVVLGTVLGLIAGGAIVLAIMVLHEAVVEQVPLSAGAVTVGVPLVIATVALSALGVMVTIVAQERQ